MFRDLFFKTTRARHPSRRLRFVYSFLRARRQVVFFVRPRTRFSAFLRLRILRKMFVWFYTDRFARLAFFRRFIRQQSFHLRSLLAFCTRLECFLPVIICRFHFVPDMRSAFYALRHRCIFVNGQLVTEVGRSLKFGDMLEFYRYDVFYTLAFFQFLGSLPRWRLFSTAVLPESVDSRRFLASVNRLVGGFGFRSYKISDVGLLAVQRKFRVELDFFQFFSLRTAHVFKVLGYGSGVQNGGAINTDGGVSRGGSLEVS